MIFYKGEMLSIIIIGYSFGGVLVIFIVYEVVEKGLNKLLS